MRPVYGDTQDEITGYEPAATVWAAIDPGFGQEVTDAGRTVMTVMIAITIRYRRDIDQRWQIQDHEHTYQIRGIADTARRRITLALTCQEIQ